MIGKVVRGKRRGLGMRARTKLFIQLIFALVVSLGLYYILDVPQLYIPGIKKEVEIGLMVYSDCNICNRSHVKWMNFTDGLDGLAGLIAGDWICDLWSHRSPTKNNHKFM